MSAETKRYSAVAIVLHWAIAIGIIWQILLGWWMGDAIEQSATQASAVAAYQVHKSVGLTILVLSLIRLAWRLINPPPPLPEAMASWEKLAAKATHWAFYILMIAMPLSGWLYVSFGWEAHDNRPLEVPTLYFGFFQVPHLFGLSHLSDAARSSLSGLTENVHSKLAWAAIGLLVLHVGAALKHQFIDRDEVLGHMVPGATPKNVTLEPASPRRKIALIAGFAAIILFFVFASYTIKTGGTSAGPVAAIEHQHEDGSAQNSVAQAALEAAPGPASAAASPVWTVDHGQSEIRFSGTHAGAAFEGEFSDWRAVIRFDPNDLAHSSARVVIATASARDGVPLHEQSLPQAEWFNAAQYPTATFSASQFRATGADRYEAAGVLNIKGRDIPVTLPFELKIDGDKAEMRGEIVIRRSEANLGQSSDPGGEWVSNDIRVRIRVEAHRAQ
jgi:cytochrome b561